MESPDLNGDIISQKGIFWTIGGNNNLVCYPIIFYQRIEVYRVNTMDMGRLICNNGVSGKYNTSKYLHYAR